MNIALNDGVTFVIDTMIRSYQKHVNEGMSPEQARETTLTEYNGEAGGYQAVANQFTELSGGKHHSRQGIHGMWERSLEGKNDFPGKHSFIIITCKAADVFDLRETGDWYEEHHGKG